MKPFLIIISILIVILALSQIYTTMATHKTETQQYKVIKVEKLFEVPHGFGENAGKDKAEGMTLLNKNELLIVFDSPADIRKTALSEVIADVFAIE